MASNGLESLLDLSDEHVGGAADVVRESSGQAVQIAETLGIEEPLARWLASSSGAETIERLNGSGGLTRLARWMIDSSAGVRLARLLLQGKNGRDLALLLATSSAARSLLDVLDDPFGEDRLKDLLGGSGNNTGADLTQALTTHGAVFDIAHAALLSPNGPDLLSRLSESPTFIALAAQPAAKELARYVAEHHQDVEYHVGGDGRRERASSR